MKILRNRKSEQGATIIEYVLIAALLAIAAIVALQGVATSINGTFTEVSGAITNATP